MGSATSLHSWVCAVPCILVSTLLFHIKHILRSLASTTGTLCIVHTSALQQTYDMLQEAAQASRLALKTVTAMVQQDWTKCNDGKKQVAQ